MLTIFPLKLIGDCFLCAVYIYHFLEKAFLIPTLNLPNCVLLQVLSLSGTQVLISLLSKKLSTRYQNCQKSYITPTHWMISARQIYRWAKKREKCLNNHHHLQAISSQFTALIKLVKDHQVGAVFPTYNYFLVLKYNCFLAINYNCFPSTTVFLL